MGPVPFVRLVETARRGTLAFSDLIRKGDQGIWCRADSVSGLFDIEAPLMNVEAEWTVDMAGQILGPLPITEVAKLIRQRKLVSSDRIRRSAGQDWQSVRLILESQLSSIAPKSLPSDRHGQALTGDNNSLSAEHEPKPVPVKYLLHEDAIGLENLIHELLSQPFDTNVKPTLAELGLNGLAPITVPATAIHAGATQMCDSTTPSAGDATTSKVTVWTRLNYFRRVSPKNAERQQHEVPGALELSAASPIALPSVSRLHETNESGGTEISNLQAAERHRHVPWLRALLLLGALSLFFQVFPGTWSTALPYLDIRRWTRGTWVMAETVVVLILGGLAIRQRRR